MIPIIEAPVGGLSSADEIRAWQRELAAMRHRYRQNPESLDCVARNERFAADLLEQATTMAPLIALVRALAVNGQDVVPWGPRRFRGK